MKDKFWRWAYFKSQELQEWIFYKHLPEGKSYAKNASHLLNQAYQSLQENLPKLKNPPEVTP